MLQRILLFLILGASCGLAQLAVVEKIAGRVSFYTPEGRRISEVPVGQYPHEIIQSPDRRSLYVTDNGVLWMTNPGQGGNTISILDVATRKRTGTIDLGNYRRPHGIDIHPKTGRMVVTIENPDGLLLIDPVAQKVLRKYDVQGADPHIVLFDASGDYAWVSNAGSSNVAVVHLPPGRPRSSRAMPAPRAVSAHATAGSFT